MRLKDAARYFDRTVCQDAYDGAAATFKAQLDLFDDSKRDGATVARRVLSVADGVLLPARGAVRAHDEVYLVGALHKDSFDSSVVRRKYVCHKASELATVQTMAQAVAGAGGTTAYGARAWIKDMKEIEVSSKLNAFFNLYFAPAEDVPIGSVVTMQGRKHLVRGSFISLAGLRLCEADELPETAVQAAVYTDKSGQVYDEEQDSYGALAPVNCNVLWHRFQSGFEYLRPAAEKFEEGDITANVRKADVAAAGAGDTFVMLGDTWRVLTARDGGDVWMLHSRRV